ncbi:hypothetical protein GGC47_001567 [Bosea sp. OAE752]|jgi:hypothetical protein|uniref:Uncharacterized protein n=1 Tax=Bosea spartocytisi TaxID=2773451 RepID=A0A927EF98_9HYPH|nr:MULTISPECIES: hypothetical protein [Bosea]MBD3849472.1 hypothetical protein [Bosea spartocytisi]MCT4471551.1 hypothetical protein [Bosea spartocytisi]
MSLKHDQKQFVSNYDECTVLLLSAFFCVTGQTAADNHLRKAIEGLLVDLTEAEKERALSNIVQFDPRHPRGR